jgi:DNA-directed DNA polymerase III PolC
MGKKDKDFVHLHVHSDASQLDGCGKVKDYVARAKEYGHTAIALTEHGTMRSYYQQLVECQAQGLKPIYGIEAYVANDMRRKGLTEEEKKDAAGSLTGGARKQAIKDMEEKEGVRRRWHLTLWAKNKIGMENLFQLSSNAWTEGFYYRPRIDIEELIKYKEGIAVATGCSGSIVNEHCAEGKYRRARQEFDRLSKAFGEDLWLEVMPHDLHEQEVANKFAMETFHDYGGRHRLLATQDAHYVDPTDWEAHEVLLCIGTNDHMDNPDRFRFGDGELYLKTRQQMYEGFISRHSYMGEKAIKDSLDNTLVFASEIDDKIIEIDRFKCLMPPISLPKKYKGDEYRFTLDMCIKGWTWREVPKRANMYAKKRGITYEQAIKVYKARLKKEINALQKQKFISYILLIRDLYEWVRKQDIMCGPGRGSAAGSFVAFLLGITSVDPIEHDLLFERFINPNRVDPPDIDCDFEDIRRQEIIEFIRQRYGEDKSSQIATISRLSGKQCIKDVARVLRVPYVEVNAITNSIIERSSGDERASQTVEDSFKDFEVCRAFNKKYPDVLKYAKVLEGMGKNLGIHAAGVVTSPVNLSRIVPLETRKYDGRDVVVTAVDMMGAQAMGLLKLDVLGLRTLGVLKDACRAIEERHGVKVDLEALELNDPKVLQGFTDHEYTGIFQYDSPGADQICKGVPFDSFEDVAAMTALNRPGTARSGLATQYVDRKKNPSLRKEHPIHPIVSEVCSDTLGIIVYQEHVQRIFIDVAGFAPGTADSLRKKIAKKHGNEALGKERENFIQGAKKKSNMDEKTAAKIIDAITFFGSYGFNKTISDQAWVLRAGANKDHPNPWIQIKDLVLAANSRTKPKCNPHTGVVSDGRLTPIAQKIKYGHFNLISMYDDFRCRPNKLKGIHDHGVKSVYEAILDDGSKTAPFAKSHRLLTTNGYKTMGELKPGDKLLYMSPNYDHSGWGTNSDSTFSQTGRNTDKYRDTVKNLWIRADYKCENCGKPGVISKGRGGHEAAHIKSPAECDYNHKAYHCLGNLKLLCNNCHKLLDYQKGERTKRWRKGRPVIDITVVEVRYVGEHQCYDLEMDTLGHNYVAAANPNSPAIVSHNSHATAYGVISYWGMWLKMYYPLEFYYALLKSEPVRQRIQNFAKDAKRHGIALMPPDVSISKKEFAIDSDENAIRGSLVDIKGVGEAACVSIMECQPFDSLVDFLSRVNKRKVHKGVVLALAKSGALDSLLPNVKVFIDNIEEWWKNINGKGGLEWLKGELEKTKSQPDYEIEERQLIASQVNPLAFGKHPIDAYADFIDKHIKVEMHQMSEPDFWDNFHDKSIYMPGVIVEVKYNQIGDFHTGELPPERERKLQFWGARYANVNIEDAGGTQNRVKFDIDIFAQMRELIDAGIGTPVLVHCVPNKKFENLRAHFAVDLESLRKKLKGGEQLNVWENIVIGKHPSITRAWKPTKNKTSAEVTAVKSKNRRFFNNRTDIFTGVVMQARLKYDKNDNKMAFFSMIDGGHNAIDCICFSSSWDKSVEKAISAGNLLSIELSRSKDQRNRGKWQYFFNGGKIRWYK